MEVGYHYHHPKGVPFLFDLKFCKGNGQERTKKKRRPASSAVVPMLCLVTGKQQKQCFGVLYLCYGQVMLATFGLGYCFLAPHRSSCIWQWYKLHALPLSIP